MDLQRKQQQKPTKETSKGMGSYPQEKHTHARLDIGAPAGLPKFMAKQNSADEPMEMQADTVAEQVKQQSQAELNPDSPDIQRRCFECTEENEVTVQRKQKRDLRTAASSTVASAVSSPSGGEALHDSVRTPVERVLNSDLSDVRVHSDEKSQQAASAIDARAFTHRHNIFLGKGESSHDLGLIAHEATHVVQQGSGFAQGLQRKPETGFLQQTLRTVEERVGEDISPVF